jgi:hypothetical protein
VAGEQLELLSRERKAGIIRRFDKFRLSGRSSLMKEFKIEFKIEHQ